MQEGTTATELVLSTDFEALVVKLLEIISVMITSKNFTIEHKMVVEDALSLIVGSIMNKNDLIQCLVDFKSKSAPEIQSGKDWILNGLLFCPADKIRLDFKNSLNALCLNLARGPNNALSFVLNVLGQNFEQIQNRPCGEFFELFNRLIDQKARLDDLANQLGDGGDDGEQVSYDPENLLNQIIENVSRIDSSIVTCQGRLASI